jgi:putative membrane protein
VWGAFFGSSAIATFFLGCVIVAGVFGAITVSRKIFWVQALPGIVALTLVGYA